MSSHSPLEAIEFAENPEPRCPCVLLLDVSGSMTGAPIQALNEGLIAFKSYLGQDALASRRVEVAVVTFSTEVTIRTDFVTADAFEPPVLSAGGLTQMGTALLLAMDMVQERKELYKRNGVTYYRPWIFMITDGAPHGEPDEMIEKATMRIHEDEKEKRVALFSVGVEGADMKKLAAVCVREPLRLTGLSFADMFVWLSASMQRVSQSNPEDDQVALPPVGWAAI